jgi:hypothetical protein
MFKQKETIAILIASPRISPIKSILGTTGLGKLLK